MQKTELPCFGSVSSRCSHNETTFAKHEHLMDIFIISREVDVQMWSISPIPGFNIPLCVSARVWISISPKMSTQVIIMVTLLIPWENSGDITAGICEGICGEVPDSGVATCYLNKMFSIITVYLDKLLQRSQKTSKEKINVFINLCSVTELQPWVIQLCELTLTFSYSNPPVSAPSGMFLLSKGRIQLLLYNSNICAC